VLTPTELLQHLLRIDTTNPPGREEPAAELLEDHLRSAGAETYIHKSKAGRASLIARVPGPRDVPALVLVSHTDVVPVEEDRWSHDPFGGEIDGGFLWGRGALDMKSIGVMHAAALAALAGGDATPRREVIVMAVADEEAGGGQGAGAVLHDVPERAGFGDERPPPEAIGEGGFGLSGILDRPLMPVVTGEKSAVWLELTALGDPGHGALPPLQQANVNLARAITKISGHRRPRVHPVMREQFAVLAEEADGPRSGVFKALASGAGSAVAAALKTPLRKQGAIASLLSDTITPTRMKGGYKQNVVPGEARASLDCRLLPDTPIDGFVGDLASTCARYRVSVTESARHAGPVSRRGPLFDALVEVSSVMHERPVVVPSLTSGITDLRLLRSRGATAYGWVPLVLDSSLLATIHGHDERTEVGAFERAVEATTALVRAVSL